MNLNKISFSDKFRGGGGGVGIKQGQKVILVLYVFLGGLEVQAKDIFFKNSF
jgi:hypothetical protein